MENSKDYQFHIDQANNSLLIKRTYPAKLETVWRAFTDAKILDQWWAPKPWKSETKSQEFKEGGKWLYAMVGPEGEKMWSVAEYQKITPQISYKVLDAFSDENGNISNEHPTSTWETKFTAMGNQTEVTNVITFKSPEDLRAILDMGFKEGYEMGQQNLIDWLDENPDIST